MDSQRLQTLTKDIVSSASYRELEANLEKLVCDFLDPGNGAANFHPPTVYACQAALLNALACFMANMLQNMLRSQGLPQGDFYEHMDEASKVVGGAMGQWYSQHLPGSSYVLESIREP